MAWLFDKSLRPLRCTCERDIESSKMLSEITILFYYFPLSVPNLSVFSPFPRSPIGNSFRKTLRRNRRNGHEKTAYEKFHLHLLISHVGPVHPVAHAHENSLRGGVVGTLAAPPNTAVPDWPTSFLSAALIPRIPRIPTAVVCSMRIFSVSFRALLSYFVGSYALATRKSNM